MDVLSQSEIDALLGKLLQDTSILPSTPKDEAPASKSQQLFA